ncbi:hypothetical protein [Paenibacillus sp. J31TS4]|uniref:hypothetical protein n=1 Tax=Paenibacillus sp. J31TS4 TaxID=2807195 RepID=UPI001BD09ED0|nr:hypothetical protein [Paenibacillus sp. J31TS4]
MTNRNRRKLALCLIGVLLLYFVSLLWIDLYPFNDLEAAEDYYGDQYLATQLGGTLFSVIVLLLGSYLVYMTKKRALIWVGFLLFLVLLLLQLTASWLPYISGASTESLSLHQRLFGETVTILPGIKDHPVPDLAHTILGLLYLLITIGAGLYLIKTKNRSV